ncbi:hypothetical protein [Pedobacter sp. MW01-1-1]|uniref:hypothetical protein n=1 Tax=Pedobacter sp. MW01-1-1 TaxID=3383027 RepID=UPI003FEF8632
MPHNPDNEFDKLFKDTFEDAEIQPTDGLWGKIEQEIAPEQAFDTVFKMAFDDAEVHPSANFWPAIETELAPKQSRKVPFLWMAAASIGVLVAIGVLLYTNRVTERPRVANNTIAPKKLPAKTDTLKAIVAEPVKQELVATQAPQPKVEQKRVERAVQNTIPVNAGDDFKLQTVIAQVAKPDDANTQIVLASNQPQQKANNTANVKPEIDLINTTPQISDEPINENEQSRTGIRNLGDLVNLVVGKVDKRKEKFIQFNTNEDDDTSISAINIGPFKLGKYKNK